MYIEWWARVSNPLNTTGFPGFRTTVGGGYPEKTGQPGPDCCKNTPGETLVFMRNRVAAFVVFVLTMQCRRL